MAKHKKPSGKSFGFGKPRPLGALRRQPGRRQPLKRLVIVCEGEKTEPLYFEALRNEQRLSSIDIKIVKSRSAPTYIVQEGIRQKKELDDERDEVWCVFDAECRAAEAPFQQAVAASRSHGLELAVSNPAFEYWYILHFVCTDRPFGTADECFRELQAHLPGYDEARPVFDELKKRLADALANADRLRRNASDSWQTFPNPSTGVDVLVHSIRDLLNNR